jgi:hypothetical protein
MKFLDRPGYALRVVHPSTIIVSSAINVLRGVENEGT